MTGSRMTLLAVLAALAVSTPAHAQSHPSLYEPAPTVDAGSATPTDTGRSTVLLGIALVAVAGAGLLTGLAIRAPRVREREQAPAPADPPPERTGRFRRANGASKHRPRRFRAARASAAEASASARMGMPALLVEEPAPEKPPWRPRVRSEVPPLPAFGSERPPDA